jgi:uroporphyrinogen decarboxylase
MNSRERVLTSLEGKIPDKIPYFEIRIDNKIIHEYGGPQYTYFDFIEELDLDGVVVFPDYDKPGAGWAGWKDSQPGEEDTLIDKWGTVRKKGISEYYADAGDEFAPIKSMEDLKTYSPPSLTEENFEPLATAVKRFKGKKAIILRARDVWSRPRSLLGYERMLVSTIDNKDLLKKTIDICNTFNKRAASIAADLGADAIITTDDIADNRSLLISPDSYREIFLPVLEEYISFCHELGLKFIKHSDGNIMAILEDFINVGIDCINPIEPYAGMELPFIKEKYGEKIAIMGNVDCRNILPKGDHQEIEQEVKRAIEEGGPAGFILSSSNSIHKEIHLSNYMTMIKTWQRYRTVKATNAVNGN